MHDHTRALIEHVNRHNLRIGVEVGVFKGVNLFGLLDACPRLMMFGVDQWKELPDIEGGAPAGYETYAGKDMGHTGHLVCLKATSKYWYRACIIPKESGEAAKEFPDGLADFVFIDGLHTEDQVIKDIEAWAPKVAPDGWIMGHDINKAPVRRAVDHVFGKNYEQMIGRVWATRKPAQQAGHSQERHGQERPCKPNGTAIPSQPLEMY